MCMCERNVWSIGSCTVSMCALCTYGTCIVCVAGVWYVVCVYVVYSMLFVCGVILGNCACVWYLWCMWYSGCVLACLLGSIFDIWECVYVCYIGCMYCMQCFWCVFVVSLYVTYSWGEHWVMCMELMRYGLYFLFCCFLILEADPQNISLLQPPPKIVNYSLVECI